MATKDRTMNAIARMGRYLIGAAALAMGVQSAWFQIYVGRLQPVPEWVPGRAVIAVVTGVFLMVVGLCILTGKWARLAALALAAMLLLWIVVLYVPKLFIEPTGAWLGTFETLAVFGGAWLLAAMLPPAGLGRWDDLAVRGLVPGRWCVGISMVPFGIAHFIYADFVASWIPKWLPFPLFWAYFTGAAHCAAGIGLLTGVLGRLAGILAGTMYGTWVLIVHIPRVYATPHDAFEWNGIFVAAALSGSAFLAGCAVTLAWPTTDALRVARE
jgi:uncharacterized membrane protein